MEEYQDFDFSEIDKVMGDIIGKDQSFTGYLDMLANGSSQFSFEGAYNYLAGIIAGELGDIKALFAKIMIIIILASVFINFSSAFKSKQVSETGFYVTYMIMFMLLAVSFGELKNVANGAVNGLMSFMEALVPTFFMAVTYVVGGEGSLVFYQSTLALLTLVDMLLVKILMPMVNVYFIFAAINPLMEEDYFSRLIELMEKLVTWGLKSLFSVVIGIGLIQGMVIPAAGGLKKGIIGKTAGAIPAVGGTVSAVLESVFGAGVLIKNGIGAAGLIVIIVICLAPLIKLAVYALIYQTSAAIAQPAANDKRMLDCIGAAAKSARLLFSVVGMSAVLFMLTIAIVVVATGVYI